MTETNAKTDPRASDYLASVFESSPLGLIALDMRLRIIMYNRAAQELAGIGDLDVVGRRINVIIRPKRLKAIINTLRNIKSPSLDGYYTKLTGLNGEEIPVRLRISPLLGPGERLLGLLVIAADLREVKRFQAKLLEAERLAAITETAISINHEINNPLCSILGNTQLLLMDRDKLDARTVKKLRSIEKEIARIREIAYRLSRITKPVLTEYIGGKRMLDVEHSSVDNPPEGKS